jgi:hypothetical protein
MCANATEKRCDLRSPGAVNSLKRVSVPVAPAEGEGDSTGRRMCTREESTHRPASADNRATSLDDSSNGGGSADGRTPRRRAASAAAAHRQSTQSTQPVCPAAATAPARSTQGLPRRAVPLGAQVCTFVCTFVSGTRKGLFVLGLCLFVCSRDTRAQRTGLFVCLPVTAYSAMTVRRQRARLAEPGAHDRHSGARRRSCADTCTTATSRARTSAGTHGRSCGAPLRGARRGAARRRLGGMGWGTLASEALAGQPCGKRAPACTDARRCDARARDPRRIAPSALPPPALPSALRVSGRGPLRRAASCMATAARRMDASRGKTLKA